MTTKTSNVPFAYLLGKHVDDGVDIHGTVLRISPDDHLAHMWPMNQGQDPDGPSGVTTCGREIIDDGPGEWAIAFGPMITCPRCGSRLIRVGEAVRFPRQTAENIAADYRRRYQDQQLNSKIISEKGK